MRAIPIGLAVARRAMLLAGVALVASGVALVAAILDSPGTDTAGPSTADRAAAEQAQAVATAAQAEAEEAAVIAGAAASRADEAAVVAREAGVMAQQAVAAAEEAAAAAAASLEAFATARAEAAVADAFGPDSEAGTEPAEATQDAAGTEPAEATQDAAATEEEPDAVAEEADATVGESETAATDGSDAAPTEGTGEPPAEPDVSLPGEPFEFGPPEGAALAVVGVSHNSVLNVRDVPNGELVARLDNALNVDGQPVVYVREAGSDDLIATLDLNRGVIATGNTRRLPTTIWHEIRMGGAVGWASGAYLAPLGATSDSTAEIVATLGETPSAPTLAELARIVAEAVASDEPPSRLVVSGAPTVGDLGEVTIDVLGLPDDSVRGFRLHVFAQQDSDSGSFVLKSVESTTICDSHRGVGEGGLCN